MRIRNLSVVKLRNGDKYIAITGWFINNGGSIARIYYYNPNYEHSFDSNLDVVEIYSPITSGGIAHRLKNIGKLVWSNCDTKISNIDIRRSKYNVLTIAELIVVAKSMDIYENSMWTIGKEKLIKKIMEKMKENEKNGNS